MPTTAESTPIDKLHLHFNDPCCDELLTEVRGDASSGPATLQSALSQQGLISVELEQCLFKRLRFLMFRREALEACLGTTKKPRALRREIDSLTVEIESTRNTIAENFLRLLASIAHQIAPSIQDYDDFFSEGFTVLLYAIGKFDPMRGYRFSTYATHAVRRHLLRYSKRRAKQQHREIVSEMSFRTEESEASEMPAFFDEDETVSTKFLIEQIDACLDEREREIVIARLGLGDDPAGKSFQSMGGYLGLSKERVRQLFNQAIRKLSRAIPPRSH